MSSTETRTEDTMPVYRNAGPCRRCKGSGNFSFGICYRCGGSGSERVEAGRRPLTVDESASLTEYRKGIAAREERAAARAARQSARRAARAS